MPRTTIMEPRNAWPAREQHGAARPRHGDAMRQAFSLIEVVAAIAVFAVGMIAVLGLFTPITKSVSTVTDAEMAARVADAVRARLETMTFEQAAALIQLPADVQAKDSDPRYNLNDVTKANRVIFGTLSGEAAFYDANATPPGWYHANYVRAQPADVALPNTDKFFEIDLIRNETLSPVTEGELPALIAYTMRVRWPAFIRTSTNATVQTGQTAGGAVGFDQSRKQLLFFTGAIRR